MSYKNKYFDPVNYKIKWNELEDFQVFLNELTDVPESRSLNWIKISQAWIANQNIFLKTRWFDWEITPVYCEVILSVSLSDHRGIHMSRCEEVLFEAVDKEFENLNDAALFIASWLKTKQWSDNAFVRINWIYFMPHITHKTRKTSYDKIKLISEVDLLGEKAHVKTWIQAYNITACPCTRTYTKFSVVPKLREIGLSIEQINKVLDTTLTGTHTQRWTITLLVQNDDLSVGFLDIYTILNTSTHLIFDLLKRPDEHDLVVRALSKPQFTEDVGRDVAWELVKQYQNIMSITDSVYIESILNDSIHIHDVRTVIDTNLWSLIQQLNGE